MKESRPSNVFISLLLFIGFFMLGAIINHVSKEFSDTDKVLKEPKQELVN